MDKAALRELVFNNCVAAGLMKFARAPFIAHGEQRQTIGDLRFDNERGLSFAEFALDESSRCPAYVPPWVEPRRDLLEEDFRN